MNKSIRLVFGIILGLLIHCFSLLVIPSISFVEDFVSKHRCITRGDVTQASFLILSLILIVIFTRGKVSEYGLEAVKLGELKNPVLLSILFSFVLISAGAVLRIVMDTYGGGSRDMIMSGGPLKAIISVWILASVSEEIFFRGFLQSCLGPLKRHRMKLFKSYISLSVMICAVWFGFGHFGLLKIMSPEIVTVIVINATVLGLLAGYYREKTGSIIPAVVVHLIFNIVGSFMTMIFM